MTTKTYKLQKSLKQKFTNSNQTKKDFIKNYKVSNADKFILTNNLKEDAKDFFFKGVFSLCSAIGDVSRMHYSWATVKLYYSIFYLLRSCLAVNRIGMYRDQRDLFYLKIDIDCSLSKIRDGNSIIKSDHKATIKVYEKEFGLNTLNGAHLNEIEGQNCFEWIMLKRELVNYKCPIFHEPNCPKFWKEIDKLIRKGQFNTLIYDFFKKDNLSLAFQSETAILALPIQLFEDVKSQIRLHVEELYTVDNFRAIQSFGFEQNLSKFILK